MRVDSLIACQPASVFATTNIMSKRASAPANGAPAAPHPLLRQRKATRRTGSLNSERLKGRTDTDEGRGAAPGGTPRLARLEVGG